MPFNGIPAKDFLNRQKELDYLQSLARLRGESLAGNVLLEGPRGIGKTELLKQVYRIIFWDDGTKIFPFYYSFKTANLKGTNFSRDYFTRFIKQYIAFLKREPFSIDNMTVPLARMIPEMASLGLSWMVDLAEDFEAFFNAGDLNGQILAAISAPVAATRKGGRPVLILLDDFTMAEQLYESVPGDATGLITLFEESMKNNLCPHIITGSPEGGLERLFTDHALLGRIERMRLHQLPEDSAYILLSSFLDKMKISHDRESALKFLQLTKGNPLYIRNLAKAAWKMQKKDLSEKDLRECYSYDVTEGETSFYWSSVLGAGVHDTGVRTNVLKIIRQTAGNEFTHDAGRLSKVLGISESEIGEALNLLQRKGFLQNSDTVRRDCMTALCAKELDGKTAEQVRETIEALYARPGEASLFEIIIPMTENAELVAARAIEQIGKNINLEPDMLNQMQLALIECCINAIEHSGSYEKKIFLKISASSGKVMIIIETPGKHFSLDSLSELPVDEKLQSERKRGWGFQLVRKIMDEVKIERVNDRTRVILIKNIQRKEVHQ
jgi:anti-sigma regulatory factor (Ser/Thr protein kinase)